LHYTNVVNGLVLGLGRWK